MPCRWRSLAGLAARAELAANGGAIATLRLVGARDRLIRGAVSRRLAVGAAAGAVAGTAAGLALVALLPRGSEQGFFLAGIGLAGWHWLLPLAVPPAAGARRLGERRRRRPARAAALELTAMLLLRSLVFDVLLYTTMAVMGVLGAPLALWSVDGAYAVCRAYCRVVFFYLRVICGLRVEVRGRVPKGEVLVAAKHQSFLDILIIFEALPRAKFIMKKELRWAPFIGLYALRIGSTPVSRGDRSKAMKAMVEHAGEGRGGAAAGHLSAGDAGGAGGAAAVQGRRRGALRAARRPLRAGGDQRRGVLGAAQPPTGGRGSRWWSSCRRSRRGSRSRCSWGGSRPRSRPPRTG